MGFLFYLAFSTRAGSPQQREPVTVGPYYLSHAVNIHCGRKNRDLRKNLWKYMEKTFGRALTILISYEDWVRVHLIGDRTRNLRDERRVV